MALLPCKYQSAEQYSNIIVGRDLYVEGLNKPFKDKNR